uniref:Putative glycine-rich cell wall structural protein n=1 Tax=Rhipicephalus microplus TaxID=6941 RepID=A0A6G5AFE9_RHIMP
MAVTIAANTIAEGSNTVAVVGWSGVSDAVGGDGWGGVGNTVSGDGWSSVGNGGDGWGSVGDGGNSWGSVDGSESWSGVVDSARTCHRSTRRRRLAYLFQEPLPCCIGSPFCCIRQQLAEQWQLWQRATKHGSVMRLRQSSWRGSFTFGVLCVFLLQGKGTQHVQSARLIIFLSAFHTSLQKCFSWPFLLLKLFCKRVK